MRILTQIFSIDFEETSMSKFPSFLMILEKWITTIKSRTLLLEMQLFCLRKRNFLVHLAAMKVSHNHRAQIVICRQVLQKVRHGAIGLFIQHLNTRRETELRIVMSC